jgi:hypothetical protein
MSVGAGSGRKRKWAQKVNKEIKRKGTEGAFTEQASKAGYSSPLEYARHVMSAPEEYPTKTVRRASFAKNVNS